MISWFRKKQQSLSTSTVEAKYTDAGSCCAQLLWMRNHLLDYGMNLSHIPMYCDKTNAIKIAENPVQHSKIKHIDVRYHFIREHVKMVMWNYILFLLTNNLQIS